MARQIGYGALTVTDVTDGINNATIYLYQRFASVTGHIPPANNKLTYNFTTGKLTGATADFNGWSQTIPNGDDPLYVVTAVATSIENTYIIPAWNDETRLVVNGEDGEDGDDGTSITAVKEVYYFTTGAAPAQSTLHNGTAITSTSTGSNVWTTVVPAYSAGGHYYTSLQTSLSKGTSPVFSAISLNQALTDANNNAAIAKSIAQANEENAQGALAISQGLESRLEHMWRNLNEPSSLPSDDTLITNDNYYLAGTYAASGIDGTTFSYSKASTYGWNSLLRHNKLMFRYNGIALTTIGTDGLKLFSPIVSNGVVTGHKLGTEITATEMNIYNPASQKVGMKLSSSGLTFYKYNSTTAAATLDGTGLNIAAGTIKLGSNFEATSDGVITAKSGIVGNLHITASSLYTGTHSAYNSTVAGIFINDTYISFGSGAVTYFKNDGSAKIGNWYFNTAGTQYADSAAISSSVTKQGRVYLAPGAVNTTNIAIGIGTRTDSSASYSWPCYMRGDGYFYASNANIQGSITAGSGTIGGWSIDANRIYKYTDSTGVIVTSDKAKYYVYIQSNAGTNGGNYAFALRTRTDAQVTANSPVIGSADVQFGVSWTGYMYARNAEIVGKITANSGKIGGWNIGTDTNKSLYYGNQTPGATTTNLVLSSTSATNTTAIAGSGTGKTWFISAGRSFGVDTAGKLYASGAVITGTLTAGSGSKVGPWFINDSSISRNSGGTAAGSYNTASNMYFGTSGISLGTTFKVSAAGVLTATGADIGGTITTSDITATGGKIGNFTLSGGVLYSNSHSAWNSNVDGVYLNSNGIAGGKGGQWYLWQDGSAKIGAMTLTAAGVLSVPAANITGTLAASHIAVSDIKIGAAQVNSGTFDSARIPNLAISKITSLQTTLDGKASTTAATNAGKTASNYLYYDSTNGLKIAQSNPSGATANYVQITSSAVSIIKDSTHKAVVNSSGMSVYSGSSSSAVASFGSTVTLGKLQIGQGTVDGDPISYINPGTGYDGLLIGYINSSGNAVWRNLDCKEIFARGAVNINGTTYVANVLSANKISVIDAATTTSSANARIGTNDPVGRLYRYSSSSQRYKHDIKKLNNETIEASHLYHLDVKQFKYNEDYLANEDIRFNKDIPGFIAEEVYEVYPIAADLDDNGNPEDWNVRYIVPPMLKLIQEQHEEIEQLKQEVQELKNK